MNVLNLAHALDITCVTGHTLSPEEIFIVQNALLLLQNENDFKEVNFLGKIFGIDKDYYLSFGYRPDAVTSRSFFYSTNQQDWFLLSEPSPCALKLTPKVSQRFTGDPRHMTNGGEAHAFGVSNGRECLLKEEDRLAAVVHLLHEDCAIAPKGAFYQNIEGNIEMSPTFQGLSLKQASDWKWWTHTHKGQSSPQSSGDHLKNSNLLPDHWVFRIRAQGSVCVLLNLKWRGLNAYHRLRTPEHGFVYFGDGLMNDE